MSTALAVVESQQQVVGRSLTGGAAAVTPMQSEGPAQILEQLRDLSLRQVRLLSEMVDIFKTSLAFQKESEMRARDQATELGKEAPVAALAPPEQETPEPNPEIEDKVSGLQKLGGFLTALPGVGFITKIFAPIMKFFGPAGKLLKIFGKVGPLGLLIGAFTLAYYYFDDIVKALTPAIDKIKEIIPKLAPLMEFFKTIGDFLIKNILEGIGKALSNLFTSLGDIIDGFIMLFNGDIIGGLKKIFGGFFDFILAIPKAVLDTVINILTPLAKMVGDFFTELYNNIVNYVTETITAIGDWFVSLKDSIVGFFVDAWNSTTEYISNAINNAIGFIGQIGDSIVDFFSTAYNTVKDFVMGIPAKIKSGVVTLFEPVISFFSSIGDSIRGAVNGFIDMLPLPDFLKKKIMLDDKIAETPKDNSEEVAKDIEKSQSTSIVQQLQDEKDLINEYARLRGLPLNLEHTLMFNKDREGKRPTLIFGTPKTLTDMVPINNLTQSISDLEKGFTRHASYDMAELNEAMSGASPAVVTKVPKVQATKLAPPANVEGGTPPVAVAVNNQNVDNSVKANTSVVGDLDTNTDKHRTVDAFS